MRTKLAFVLAFASLAGTLIAGGGCYEDPNNPQTWIKKLGDPRQRDTAVTHLMQIKDAVAVKPLLQTYEDTKSSQYLDDALSFHSKDAIPEIETILTNWNPTDNDTDAMNAANSASAECINLADPSLVPTLTAVLAKATPPTGQANLVKANAIDALGAIKDKGSVSALVTVLSADPANQPIMLNLKSAVALGAIGDPTAVPPLIKALFITGKEPGEQGLVIFPQAKMALLHIGDPAVQPLIDLMQHKNADVEALDKAGNWEASNPGVVVWKAEAVLGDMHAKAALPYLLKALNGPTQGLVQQYALYALGRLADPSTEDAVIHFSQDTGRASPDRLHANEALVFYLDPKAESVLWSTVHNPVANDDPNAPELLMLDAMLDFVRLAGPDVSAAQLKEMQSIHDGDIPEAQPTEQQAIDEATFAQKCGKTASCYEQALKDGSDTSAEDVSLFQLARLGDATALPIILQIAPQRDPPTLRDASLFALEHFKGTACPDCDKVLSGIITTESQEKNDSHLVEETQITQAYLDGQLK
jgi:HEAT repeat protein